MHSLVNNRCSLLSTMLDTPSHPYPNHLNMILLDASGTHKKSYIFHIANHLGKQSEKSSKICIYCIKTYLMNVCDCVDQPLLSPKHVHLAYMGTILFHSCIVENILGACGGKWHAELNKLSDYIHKICSDISTQHFDIESRSIKTSGSWIECFT